MAGSRPVLPLSAAILAALASAASTGMLVADASAQVAKKPDDENDGTPPLLLISPKLDMSAALAHQSHSSHSSHSSHYSGSGGGGHSSHSSHSSHYSSSGGGNGGGDWSGSQDTETPTPTPSPVPTTPPPPPKPAQVTLVAFPGGKISIDGNVVGHDSTSVLTLKAGPHSVVIENKFLGKHETTIDVEPAQTGVVKVEW